MANSNIWYPNSLEQNYHGFANRQFHGQQLYYQVSLEGS